MTREEELEARIAKLEAERSEYKCELGIADELLEAKWRELAKSERANRKKDKASIKYHANNHELKQVVALHEPVLNYYKKELGNLRLEYNKLRSNALYIQQNSDSGMKLDTEAIDINVAENQDQEVLNQLARSADVIRLLHAVPEEEIKTRRTNKKIPTLIQEAKQELREKALR